MLTLSIAAYSQQAKIYNANNQYDNLAYIDAIKTYEKIANKGYKSEDIYKKLANSYYFNADLENAAKWYTQLFEMNSATLESEYYFRYAHSLRAIGDNKKANDILIIIANKEANDSRAKLFIKNVNYLDAIKANSGRYKIEDAGINSIYSDYGSALYKDQIIFATARDTGGLSQRKHKWTNQYFTNLYSATLAQNMTPYEPKKFNSNINSKFNESTPTFSKDGQTIYFTRNNYLDGKKGKDGDKITLIKIYRATLVNGDWNDITELPFNNDNYSTAHPTVSHDGNTLYFASDMPGTLGNSDLFKVKINGDGTYGVPENLGNTINTEGRETFPFISDDNELYFASDGHPGVGGLDVFVATAESDGFFKNIQNLGSDINSPQDDFAYLIDTNSRRGFFTSNRDGGMGYDDVYKFLETRKIVCEQVLYGEITDFNTGKNIPNAKLTLLDKQYKEISTTTSDDQGNYTFKVNCGKEYYVRVQKEEYTATEKKVIVADENGRTYLPITLENAKCVVTVGDDLGKCFNIKMIYFNLDKSNIRKEAAIDLEKILDVLISNPTMKLDIRSHTDSRQTHAYNKALSDRRAKSTIEWLVKNGVNKNRLTGKGYGETQLVNKCTNNVKCTEEEHQLNRRSEFIITAL